MEANSLSASTVTPVILPYMGSTDILPSVKLTKSPVVTRPTKAGLAADIVHTPLDCAEIVAIPIENSVF